MAETKCKKCGAIIQLPDPAFSADSYSEAKLAYWGRRQTRAILKHAWDKHREDFPPVFSTFNEFMKWAYTPEGRAWDHKQGLLSEAEDLVSGKGEL